MLILLILTLHSEYLREWIVIFQNSMLFKVK